MRAGKLDREIVIAAYQAGEPDEFGVSTPAWSTVATMRAQILKGSTEEYLRGYGEGAAETIVFRTWWIADVTTEHRVTYEGRHFSVKETKEIGRREGLELRCEVVRA